MNAETLKKEFLNFSISDKIRCYQFVNEEISKIKSENPRNYSNMLCYVNNPEKSKERTYKQRIKNKDKDIIKLKNTEVRDETMNMIITINKIRGTE